MTRSALVSAAALMALALAPSAPAAAPAVPTQTSYQGVLLDTAGVPRSGNVDLTLRIWDALSGGTLVYTQQFSNVPLVDGVFTVRLGPTGAATDTPADPLTTSLASALGGDAGATAPGRFLEVTVGSEGALLRSQILAAPYALRAASADSAATAAVADNVTAVNGLDAAVLNQLYQYGNSDGQGLPNTDPSEGTGDVDGDGAMNFVDPDNDGDGILDGTELGRGSNVNLVTPTLGSLTPASVPAFPPVPVMLNGLQFDPAMTVFLDGAPIAPTEVTPTSAKMQPTEGHPLGTFPVYVQLPNGERSLDSMLTITGSPPPGTIPDLSNTATVSFGVRGAAKIVIGNEEEYAIDFGEDGATDGIVDFDLLPNPPTGSRPHIAVAWGGDGHLLGLRCKPNASGCQIQVIRDSDDDLVLSDAGGDEVLLGPSYTGTQLRLWGPGVATDPSGHLVAAYVLVGDGGAAQVTVLHDRDGSGSFAATAPETVVVQSLSVVPGAFGKLAVHPAGRVAYAYVTAGPSLRIAYDRNGDGDFSDSGETFTAYSASGSHLGAFCGGVAFDASGRLAAAFGESIAAQVRVLRDLNGDGDFADAGDVQTVLGSTTSACDIAGHPTAGIALVHGGAGLPDPNRLLIDRNDDGDFDDANESQALPVAVRAVTFSGDGRAWALGADGLFVDLF